jgi:hypothetical protein
MQELDAEGRICYPDSKDKRPQLKRYLEEMSGHLVASLLYVLFYVHLRNLILSPARGF